LKGNYFSFRVVNSWNSQPDEVVTDPSLNLFKGRFKKYWKNLMFEIDDDPSTANSQSVSQSINQSINQSSVNRPFGQSVDDGDCSK